MERGDEIRLANLETMWAQGLVICLDCEHTWRAVRPVGTINLECPECGATCGTSIKADQ
jgi:hypothetical protein